MKILYLILLLLPVSVFASDDAIDKIFVKAPIQYVSGEEFLVNGKASDAEYSISELQKLKNVFSLYDFILKREEVKKIDLIVKALELGIEVDNSDITDENDKREVKGAEIKNEVRFYLGTIFYLSSAQWSAWINGNKYTQQRNGDDNFRISDIKKNMVECIWKTGYSRFVGVLKRAKELDDMPDGVEIIIEDDIATVIFILRANQSFILGSSLRLVEGR
jgi:hypothetical protein